MNNPICLNQLLDVKEINILGICIYLTIARNKIRQKVEVLVENEC